MTDFIPVNEPDLGGREKEYLIECIESGWISSEGPFVSRFETEMADRVGRSYGIAVSSGTAALDIAIESLQLSTGDEVIVPAMTIMSCIHQVLRSGAVPVFVDCDPHTWNMDVSSVKEAITTRTKAILAVHIYGLPVDMDPLLEIADEYGLNVVEDAAEAIGLDYKGRQCGSMGHISTLSFYPNKHITTGEGGMILTDDSELADRCGELRNLCFQKGRRFYHENLGWNYRMTNMQAALGVAQLERLDAFLLRKREIGRRYQRNLSTLESLQLPVEGTDYAENLYWVFGVVNTNKELSAEKFMTELAQQRIGTRPFFFPLNLQPVLSRYGYAHQAAMPNSEWLSKHGFYLPSGLTISDQDIDRVSHELIETVGKLSGG